MSGSAWQAPLCIEANHPALPGHFPGYPLVPGVLMLEQVALALRAWRGQRLARVLEVKFLAPLLPGQQAEITLDELATDGTRLRFAIHRGDTLLARGTFEGVPP